MSNQRLQTFLREPRRFTTRLLLALPTALGVAFTFIIFGVLDLFIQNHAIMPFLLRDVLVPTLLLGLLVFVALALLLPVLRGKLFDLAVSLLFGGLLAGYLQGTFLNLNLGQLNGDAIIWTDYIRHALLNLALWGGLLALPLVIYYFSRRLWTLLLRGLPLVLVAMQLTGLVSSLLTTPLRTDRGQYLSARGLYELSTQNNILVFVVDRLDTDFIQEIREQRNPTFFDRLDGFTYYPNTTSLYARSYPSIPYLLTGQLCYFDTPGEQYCDTAYRDGTLLPALRQAGFTTKLYMAQGYTYSDLRQLTGLADNIADGWLEPKRLPILKEMLRLSAYRYVPHALKPTFWMSTGAFDGMMATSAGIGPYQTDDHAIYRGLLADGLTTQSEQNNFIFLHMQGSHHPFTINENVEQVPEGQTSTVRQTMGCFEIIYKYLDKMKALGLYDDATVIITGDHGKSENLWPLKIPKTTALFYKPGGSANTPLAESAAPLSHANFAATVLSAAGLDTAGAPTFADIPEGAPVTRQYFYRVSTPQPRRDYLEEFIIDGDARDFNHWHKQREIDVQYPFG